MRTDEPRRPKFSSDDAPSADATRSGPFRYRAAVLQELWKHGVSPTERTPPALAHEFVSDLYRWELRRLRDRLIRGEFPKTEYYGRVLDLRRRYPAISMKPAEWVE